VFQIEGKIKNQMEKNLLGNFSKEKKMINLNFEVNKKNLFEEKN